MCVRKRERERELTFRGKLTLEQDKSEAGRTVNVRDNIYGQVKEK